MYRYLPVYKILLAVQTVYTYVFENPELENFSAVIIVCLIFWLIIFLAVSIYFCIEICFYPIVPMIYIYTSALLSFLWCI